MTLTAADLETIEGIVWRVLLEREYPCRAHGHGWLRKADGSFYCQMCAQDDPGPEWPPSETPPIPRAILNSSAQP